METTEKKLSDLIAGDKVIASVRNKREIRIIKRVTNTRIIIEWENYAGQGYERQFEKKNGREWGNSDSYYYSGIRPYTEQEEKEIISEKKRKEIEQLSIRFPNHDDFSFIDEVHSFLTSKGFLK